MQRLKKCRNIKNTQCRNIKNTQYRNIKNIHCNRQDIWTDGFVGFLICSKVLQAHWLYIIAGILKLLWPLQDIWTDGLVSFEGLDIGFPLMAFGLVSVGSPDINMTCLLMLIAVNVWLGLYTLRNKMVWCWYRYLENNLIFKQYQNWHFDN